MASELFEKYINKAYEMTGIPRVINEELPIKGRAGKVKKEKTVVVPPVDSDPSQEAPVTDQPIQPDLPPEQIGDVQQKTDIVMGWIKQLNERFMPMAQFDLATTMGEGGVKDMVLTMKTADGRVDPLFYHIASGPIGDSDLAEVVKLAEAQLGKKAAMGEALLGKRGKSEKPDIVHNEEELLGVSAEQIRKSGLNIAVNEDTQAKAVAKSKKLVLENTKPKDPGIESIEELVPFKPEKGWVKIKKQNVVYEFEKKTKKGETQQLFIEVVTPKVPGDYKKLKPGYTVVLLDAVKGKTIQAWKGITEEMEMRKIVKEAMK